MPVIGTTLNKEDYDYSPISKNKHDFVIMEVFDKGEELYFYQGRELIGHEGVAILWGLETKAKGPTEGQPKDLSVYLKLGKNSLGNVDRKSVLWELFEAVNDRDLDYQQDEKVDTDDLIGQTVSVYVGHVKGKKDPTRVRSEAKGFLPCKKTLADFPFDLANYESIGTRWNISPASIESEDQKTSFDFGANKKDSDNSDKIP